MKTINIIIIFLTVLITYKASAEMLILDKLDNPGKTTQGQIWSFFTDGVMGGLSQGKVKLDKIENIECYRMLGNVTTANNGGFIQIRSYIKPTIKVSDYEGIYLKVYGNNKKYSLHIRTPLTVAPWQYYSYSFESPNNWNKIKAPFSKFNKSNFYQPKNLKSQKIKTIGLVAGFDDFQADICLSEIGLY